MLEAISTNVVDGSASTDFKAALNELLLTMYNNGAPFGSEHRDNRKWIPKTTDFSRLRICARRSQHWWRKH